MSDRPTGTAPSRLVAVLGPTNTGKTHLAVERMLGHASGMIGLPLRLLAREIYDRIVRARGARCVALVTGEEKIIPPRPQYWVCTVEAMPLSREVEFLAIDEVQLCGDPERGHAFTHRLLHARGTFETMFLGAASMAPLIRRLLPAAEIISRERFSRLSYAGSKKLTRLPPRTAVVAFSADAVYAIAELVRRQRGGAAVVMGSLSPRTRNAQVALYQSGEVDFLVATDAIGMGLNMDVDHVAFAGLRKFDGKRTRWLQAQEIGQVAGRAGRFRTDGTFGVTGECDEMDEDLVEAVEAHDFEPVVAAEWRSAKLEFTSLASLQRSLAAPSERIGLKLAAEGLDEKVLSHMAQAADVVDRCRNLEHLRRLWEVCQTPDFRKIAPDEHLGLVRFLFDHLTSGDKRLPDDWIDGQFRALDYSDGEIDALSGRLAGVRTLAYVANRPDWLRDPTHWQARTRQLEDRLSDTLHQKLMLRFIDRRTSALMRSLKVREEMLAGVGPDGAVTVEGHFIGRLRGVSFETAASATTLEDKALRGAAQRAIGPEVTQRLGRLAAEPDEAFALDPDGVVLWRGEAVGQLEASRAPALAVSLFGELGSALARDRAARRLEAFISAEAARRLKPLKRIEMAVTTGRLKGLARGVAYRLLEAGGVLERETVTEDVRALSQSERRELRALGVRFGRFSLFVPALLSQDARDFAVATSAGRSWRPPLDRPSALPSPPPDQVALAARGLRAVGDLAVPVEALEQLDALIRSAPLETGAAVLADDALLALGWTLAQAVGILACLGYTPAKTNRSQGSTAWRRRRPSNRTAAPLPLPPSPFAALAALRAAPARRSRRRKRPGRPPAASAEK